MATTTNYGWTTPDDTALVKDGASAIRTLGSSIDTTTKNLNPSTTLGDIEYRSSTANTNTRLAIGTSGQVLTVSGGVPAWATPATPTSGLTFISRTSFTSAANVTIDDLFSDTYEHYLIRIQMKNVTSSATPRLRARYGSTTESGSVYWSYGVLRDTSGSTTGFTSSETTSWQLDNSLSTGNLSSYSMNLWRGNGSGVLVFDGTLHSRSLVAGGAFAGWCNASQTWTGLYLFPDSNTMTGTITVYGMAKS